jgi:hypothetical protein
MKTFAARASIRATPDLLPYGPVAEGGFAEERRELLRAVSCFCKRRERRLTGGIHYRPAFVLGAGSMYEWRVIRL